MSSSPVGMLDLGLGVLHRAGSVHLRTWCGRDLVLATVGPIEFVEKRAESRCPQCFREGDPARLAGAAPGRPQERR